jgi:uncharacterized protein with FMN-binding domain
MKRIFFVLVPALVLFAALVMFFPACTETGVPAVYTPGAYQGTGEGQYGPVRVEVTVSARAITRIEVLEHGETLDLGTAAFEELGQEVIESNSVDLNALSGASGSSRGFLSAVEDALSQARLSENGGEKK